MKKPIPLFSRYCELAIESMTDVEVEQAKNIESKILKLDQIDLRPEHFLLNGIYFRTIYIPRGGIVSGALIKISTTVIISGDALIVGGKTQARIKGYKIIPAKKHRKQTIFAFSETVLTMLFRTDAETVSDAEEEFTDEVNKMIKATEVKVCQEQ